MGSKSILKKTKNNKKKVVRKYPKNFLCDKKNQHLLQKLIDRCAAVTQNQEAVNDSYEEFVRIVNTAINEKGRNKLGKHKGCIA